MPPGLYHVFLPVVIRNQVRHPMPPGLYHVFLPVVIRNQVRHPVCDFTTEHSG
jgi:hypothetical protein